MTDYTKRMRNGTYNSAVKEFNNFPEDVIISSLLSLIKRIKKFIPKYVRYHIVLEISYD